MRLSAKLRGPLNVLTVLHIESLRQTSFGGNHVAAPGFAPLRLVDAPGQTNKGNRQGNRGNSGAEHDSVNHAPHRGSRIIPVINCRIETVAWSRTAAYT